MIGALINIQNHNGDTALHLAAGNGYTATVRFLLRVGASKKIKNKDTLMTPGQVATAKGYHTCAQFILEFFTPVRSPNNLLQFLDDKLPQKYKGHGNNNNNNNNNNKDNNNNNLLNSLQDTFDMSKLSFNHMMNSFSFSSSIIEPLVDLIPYFRARRLKAQQDNLVKSAAKKILVSSTSTDC
jgi:ankyrin repeat protein